MADTTFVWVKTDARDARVQRTSWMTEACTAATTEEALWPARRPRLTCHNRVVASRWANWQHAARLGAGLIAGATGLAVFVLPQPTDLPASSYTGHSLEAAALFVAAGLRLTLAGLAASRTRQAPHLGDLAMLAGFLWFAPAFVGRHGGPELARSIGMVASAFTVPVIFHVVHAFPDGRGRRPAAFALITALYVEAALSALALALVRDPFYDPSCWDNCTDNAFLLHSMPGIAHAVQVTDRWFVALAATAFAGMCGWRVARTASRPGLRTFIRAAGPGMLLALAVAAQAIALLIRPIGRGLQPGFPGHLLHQLHGGHTAGRWFDLARDAHPGAAACRRTDRVPPPARSRAGVRWLPHCERLSGDSRLGGGLLAPRLEPVRGCERQSRAPARCVARAYSHRSRPKRATDRGGVAHGCALESSSAHRSRGRLLETRLQAEVLARLEEIRASRARIVETGDAERRRIERDLHDGVQQRLIALSYDIRLAHTQADADGDAATTALLARAVGEAHQALGELRELAHGIYPAILGEAGLGPALATLADEASLPVEVVADLKLARYPEPIETAAYLTAVEAVDDAVSRNAGYAAISVVEAEGKSQHLCRGQRHEPQFFDGSRGGPRWSGWSNPRVCSRRV